MTQSPFRASLVASSLIIVVGTVALVVMVFGMRGRLEERIGEDLRVRVEAARRLVDRPVTDPDSFVDELGTVLEARVTWIGPDGVVLGDTERDGASLAAMDNHGRRPEVVVAEVEGIGVVRRYSATIRTDMLYAAAALGGRGWIRVGVPLREIDVILVRLGTFGVGALFLALAAGLVGIALNGALIGTWMHRAMEEAQRHLGIAPSRAPDAGSIFRLSRELERLVDQLGTSRHQLFTILETMESGVVAVGGGGRILVVNPQARALLELEEQAGDFPSAELREQLLLGGDEEGPSSFEVTVEVAGRERLITANAGRSPDGSRVFVVRDITEQRRAERVRRDFVANASHELRTPVAVMQTHVETLLDGALEEPEVARRFVEGMHRHTRRLSELLRDLLDLSRIEAGRYAVDLVSLDVFDAFGRVQETLSSRASDRDVRLELDVSPGLRVLADEGALEQILTNLLDNAVKYAPPGSAVELVGRAKRGRVVLEVRDSGPGIAPEHRRRLFERFYRVDPGRDRAIGGTGLGLAIVKHLVGSMDGAVAMRANEPTGSVFYVSLRSPGV